MNGAIWSAEQPVNARENQSGVEPPSSTALPFFAYGALKPDEIGFYQVEGHVSCCNEGQVRGLLLVRDGLPLLDLNGKQTIDGWILDFGDARELAYAAIGRFEPKALYRWADEARTTGGDRVNLLVGRSLMRGNAEPWEGKWSSASDPVFARALPLVRSKAEMLCARRFVSHPYGLDNAEWDRFFEIKAAYLLLWSVIERVTTLAFGTLAGPSERNTRCLGEHEAWRKAVAERLASLPVETVFDSRNPSWRAMRSADDPVGTARFYYQVRSNMCHRGKAGFRDAELARQALAELADLTDTTLRNMRLGAGLREQPK